MPPLMGCPSASTSKVSLKVSVFMSRTGGLLTARNTAPHPPEWPAPVVEVKSYVAAFPIRHLAAIMAYYFHMALTAEVRQQRYIEIARKVALTRPCDPGSARSLGKGAFAHDLDRARLVLKAQLGI
jgi:hypothetical protein